MSGIGGGAEFIRRNVQVQFADDVAGVIQGSCEVWVAASTEVGLYGIPSLLGRDLLGQFSLTVNEPAGIVTLELPPTSTAGTP